MRIGVCRRGFLRLLAILREALPEHEIFECDHTDVVSAAQDADVLIPIMTTIPPAALASPRLKLVQQYGVGLDGVDIPAATASGVWVANIPSVGSGNAESVAELAIGLMIMVTRNIPVAFERFNERRFGQPMGQALWRSTVAILGYGGIGEEIARRLAGFEVELIAISRSGPTGSRPRDPRVPLAQHVAAGDAHAVLGRADHVVVAAPATPENLGLVDARMIAAMKRGVTIVNIARGPVIEYQALLDGLRSGQVAGAGLDVFWQEPFDPTDPLLAENVIATPHIAGVTSTSLNGIGAKVVANIRTLERGEIPANCVNPQARSAAS